MRYFDEGRFAITLSLFFMVQHCVFATILTPDLPREGVISDQNNKFLDPNIDYSKFMGRVSDKSDSGRVLKIQVENNNTKFLKAGDLVYFKVNTHEAREFCKASVRTAEDFFFSIYVQDFDACWDKKRYFPRGVQLNFKADKMAQRVYEASYYRKLLIDRKEGFLKQLNGINHFLWTYDQQKLKKAAEYDEQINNLMREKQLAMDNLINKKQESILLQSELVKKLNSLDESLDHYRVERQEPITDRWFMDHDRNLPVMRRPQRMKHK